MSRRPYAAVVLLLALLASVVGTRAGAADAYPPPSITTVAGTPCAGPALGVGQLPHAIVLRGADLYVADPANDVIRAIRLSDGMERVVAGNGSPVQIAADADGPNALTSSLYSPVSIAFDPLGNLFIAETDAGRIRKVTPRDRCRSWPA